MPEFPQQSSEPQKVIDPQDVGIVCKACGDSSPFRCRQRGCRYAAANLEACRAFLAAMTGTRSSAAPGQKREDA